MTIMGMDPSLNGFGLAYRTPGGELKAYRVSSPKGLRGLERLQFLQTSIAWHLEAAGTTFVAYEDYAMGVRISNTLFGLGELGGVIKLLLYTRGIAILTVPPTSLKLFATGNGRAEKGDIAKYVKATEGIEFPSTDQNDAVALLRLGEAANNVRLLPRDRRHPQRRALAGCIEVRAVCN